MPNDAAGVIANVGAGNSGWAKWLAFLERAGERCNPILVKEARQAMKSRQFSITFVIVLVLVWVCTIFAVAGYGTDLHYRALGGELFFWFYLILTFPLAVIVPYGAFRSMAQECEDRTYELLSITTLHPRQIILGKLASAMLQMLVYFSAVAPCLAFTYLLRGIDIMLILYMLGIAGLGSLGLSLIGLFLATVSSERHWQIVLSVLFIVGLVFTFMGANAFCEEMIRREYRVLQSSEFWLAMGAMFTFYISTFALILCATTAQLTFPTDNRSTPLRVAMVAQTLLYIGWCAAGIRLGGDFAVEMLTVMLCFAVAYWFLMGAFMVAESPNLSLRVRRTLPDSLWGNALFGWFFPGPGRGYLFALSGFAGCAAAAWIAPAFYTQASRGRIRIEWQAMALASVLMLFYLVIYLGMTKIVVRWLRRRGWPVSVAVGPLIASILLLAGVLGPMFLQSAILGRPWDADTVLFLPNPFMTLALYFRSRLFSTTETAIFILAGLWAFTVFAFNLRAVFQDLNFVKVAQPVRVLEDEAVLHPPPLPGPTNPWDAEPEDSRP